MSTAEKRAFFTAAAGGFLLAAILGLWFMGVLSFGGRDEETVPAETAAAEDRESWEAVFSGMKFFLPKQGMAAVHESGCLNVRQKDEYLIQIDMEDDTIEDMWARMEDKKKVLTDSGYRIEKEPEWIDGTDSPHIRYVISMADERGSDFRRSYFEVLLLPADGQRHFLAAIRYDGIDVEALREKQRESLYDEAADVAADILKRAVPTDEEDDLPGTFWMEDENLDPGGNLLAGDCMTDGDDGWSLSYRLPPDSQLVSDNVAGKTYLDTKHQIYILLDVTDYTWETAKQKAQSLAQSELSRIHDQGQVEVGDYTFYYYSYSVLEYGEKEKLLHSYFHAYCDLKNGSIYSVYGYADDCPMALEPGYYADVFSLTETGLARK